jgi:hypothetical protein
VDGWAARRLARHSYSFLAVDVWGGLRLEVLEEQSLVETGQLLVDCNGEEFVGEAHKDPVVAGGMLGAGGFEFGGHERRAAGSVEEMVGTSAQLSAGGIAEDESAADPAAEGQQVGSAEVFGEPRITGEHDARS